jgi:hypothetical protein
MQLKLQSQSQSYITTDVQSPMRFPRPQFHHSQTDAGLLMWGAFCDERTSLSFTIAAGPRQGSHCRVRVPRYSWPYVTVSDMRFPKPGGSGPRIYIPQEQGAPVITPGTGLHFCRLLRLAGYIFPLALVILYSFDTDCILNNTANSSSICVHSLLQKRIYHAVAYQWRLFSPPFRFSAIILQSCTVFPASHLR